MRREWLINKRTKRGLTREEIAKLCDVTYQMYGCIENGKRRPGPDLAIKLGKILKFDWTKFYE